MLSKTDEKQVNEIISMQGSKDGAIEQLFFERKFAVESMYMIRRYMIRILQDNPIENISLTAAQSENWQLIENICGDWSNVVPNEDKV
tara:strand:+ start:98 stop:361 length:264 start_codon:yes stop_codon:yes gene_type:complete